MPLRPWMRWAGPAGLMLLVVCFFWKLAMTGEFVWFDHPDMVYLEIPRLQFQAREMHNGRFPLWDPSIWGGQSLIGQTQPGPLFPLQILALLLPLRDGYLRAEVLNGYWVFLHVLAALGCYALCREWGRSRTASVLAGIGFGCGGFLGTVAWVDVAAGAIFTPVILLFVTRAWEGRRPWASGAAAGVTLGMTWLSGHHEIPLLVSLAVGCVWAGMAWRRRALAGVAVASMLVAGLVAAVQVWPTIEFGRLSKRWVGMADPVGWNDRISYAIAKIYSLPAKGVLETALPSAERYADCAPFLGLAIVGLALLGLLAGEGRVRWVAMGTAFALLFAMGAGTPVHGVLYSLVPGLGKARIPVRAIHFSGLGLCLLAAYGLDAWRAGAREWAERWLGWGLLGLGVLIVVAAGAGREMDARVVLSGMLALGMAAMVLRRARGMAWAWVAVAAVEMYGVSTATYSSRFTEGQFRFARLLEENRDIAAFLRVEDGKAPVRIDVNETDIPLNFGDYHGLDAMGGYMAGVPENLLRAETHLERTRTIFAITHFVGKEPQRAEQVEVYRGASGVRVFRNPEARPRVWSVHEAATAAGLAGLEEPEVHRRTVLAGEAPALEKCEGDEVALTGRGASRMRIRAKMACRGMVILGDSYYPGWEATVDGQAARVWEAYGCVRGVVVPAGEHTVEMRFRPRSVYGGAALFLLGLAVAAGLVWFDYRPKT